MEASPSRIAHAGYTVLRMDASGWVEGDPTGLFDYDTRILSRYLLTIDGRTPELIGAATPEAGTFVARYRVPRDGADADGPLLPQDALELDVVRRVGSGMHDRWTFRNHSAVEWSGRVALEADADFADIAEVGRERQQQ